MTSINDAKRLVKRVLLSNIVSDKPNLALTPLISGKHGIGKSAMIKTIADDIGGTCITVEGGTLKEGEITGLPYQYKDDNGKIKFRFLPYYAVERIQNEEKRLFAELKGKKKTNDLLSGDENSYSIDCLTATEKIELIKNGTVHPVIIFIDEINRTENTVYKELMNILLTRSVNGYRFPWWVLFVGAMNPSTQNSVYATNEMDPAQLDRFIKIKVNDDVKEWLKFGQKNGLSADILDFINENPECLSSNDENLTDDEKPTPSPRGWDMVDSLLKAEPQLRSFFDKKENSDAAVNKDMKTLVGAKLGSKVSAMFFASLKTKTRVIEIEDIFNDTEELAQTRPEIEKMSSGKTVQLSDKMLDYLNANAEFMMLDKKGFSKKKKQLSVFVNLLNSATRLLFAQKMSSMTTDEGNSLIGIFMDVFEEDLLGLLDLSDSTKEMIKKA